MCSNILQMSYGNKDIYDANKCVFNSYRADRNKNVV